MWKSQWLTTATWGVRFGPDRKAVRAELEAHLEDKEADLLRLYPDLSPREAETRVLREMGDPIELQKELAKVHRPWLGYLWRASQTLLGLAVALTLWTGIPRAAELVQSRMEEQDTVPSVWDCYLRGEDPFQPGSPHASETEETGAGVTRTPLLTVSPTQAVQAGQFRLRVTQAALWSFAKEDGTESRWLFWEVEAQGPPWLDLSPVVLQEQVRGVDSLGNRYLSTLEGHMSGRPYIRANPGESGLLSQRFEMSVDGDLAPGAEWFRLEYDWGGTQWSLTIPLTGEERTE